MLRPASKTTLLLAAFLLAGCVGADYSTAYGPTNDPDKLYCRQYAASAVAMPSIPQSQSPPAYRVTGTFNRVGAPTTTFQGTATPIRNAGDSFLDGVSSGAAIGAALEAKRARNDVFSSCMASRATEKPARKGCPFPAGYTVKDPLGLYPECKNRA